MVSSSAPILVTGANGNLGRLLIARAAQRGIGPLRALVRSERAAQTLREAPGCPEALELRLADYGDAAALAGVTKGCRAVVHLVGIIKQTRGARYVDAHERSCELLARAASDAGVTRIVYLSILGSRPDAANACLASKGRAEEILLRSGVPTTVLRVPMVLGPTDYASFALRRQATAPFVALAGGGRTWHQPIDASDVVEAILAALHLPAEESGALDLAGPEALTQRQLVERTAALHGRRPRVVAVPLTAVRAFAALAERLFADPPLTRAMLEVLQHDDRVDPTAACAKLRLELTPLDDTLRSHAGPEARHP